MRSSLSILFLLATASVSAAGESPMRTLDYFKGAWACSGVFPASGKTIASRMTYADDLQGAALVKHHDDTSPQAHYHAIEAWAYEARGKRFNAAIVDSFGGARRFGSPGWRNDTLTWESAAEVQPAQRFVYVRLDERHYRVDWEINRDDKAFVVGDTLTCTRQP